MAAEEQQHNPAGETRLPRESRQRAIQWPALASGFMASLALLVSTYNVYLQRQQIRAQVWPRLEWARNSGEASDFEYLLLNSGVGPAEIKAVDVTVDGAPVRTWGVVLDKVIGSRTGFGMSSLRGRVIAAGAVVKPLRLGGEQAKAFEAQAGRVGVEICYCSTLGDCWRLRYGRSSGTDSVDDCARSGEFTQ